MAKRWRRADSTGECGDWTTGIAPQPADAGERCIWVMKSGAERREYLHAAASGCSVSQLQVPQHVFLPPACRCNLPHAVLQRLQLHPAVEQRVFHGVPLHFSLSNARAQLLVHTLRPFKHLLGLLHGLKRQLVRLLQILDLVRRVGASAVQSARGSTWSMQARFFLPRSSISCDFAMRLSAWARFQRAAAARHQGVTCLTMMGRKELLSVSQLSHRACTASASRWRQSISD
jgi:hypothetical protein